MLALGFCARLPGLTGKASRMAKARWLDATRAAAGTERKGEDIGCSLLEETGWLTRVSRAYPELIDDDFVAAHRDAWLR